MYGVLVLIIFLPYCTITSGYGYIRNILRCILVLWERQQEVIQLENVSAKTGRLVRMAVLVAILLLMAYTPLGYLKVGIVEISFMMLPVVVGAIVIGPGAGAILGGIFGLTSFIQCFGASVFGATLLGINPIFTFITCMIPRILAGWLPGLIFKAMYSRRKNLLSFVVGSISGAALNTIFFVVFLLVLFGGTDYVQGFGSNVWQIIVTIVGTNGLIEAAVCAVVGTAVTKALYHFVPMKSSPKPADSPEK